MTSLNLPAAQTALVLIDLQHGVVGLPLQPISAAVVLETSRALADTFRQKGAVVVYVRVDLPNMLPVLSDISHGDTSAAPPLASELVPDAGFQAGDLFITKRHWSAFCQTALEAELRQRNVDTIVLAGIATNFGVESTAREAVSLGFQVVIAADCCSSMDANAHSFAMDTVLPLIARVRSSDAIVNAVS